MSDPTTARASQPGGTAIFLAADTVENQVSRIMAKLHARTRTELAVMTVRSLRD